MAELINKKDAIAIVNSIPCATLEEECTKSVAVGCIVRLSTTTEAEIRAKAIDDFYKALEELTKKNWIDHLEYGITWADIDEIAEQLKESD